jgi:hypothetical protein
MRHQRSSSPPDNLPTYRILTGPDDAAFCRRVSDAIALGYVLYGSPAAAFNGASVIVAQALVWPSVQSIELKRTAAPASTRRRKVQGSGAKGGSR